MASILPVNSQILPYITSNDPLPDHLRPLLETERQICQRHIVILSRQMLEIHRNFRAPQDELGAPTIDEGLHEQQWAQANRTQRALLSTVSAFRRLPAEIIAAIMTQAVRCDSNLSHPSADRVAFQVLRCVSQRWRRTAFSTPSLWRRLDIDLRGFLGENHSEIKSNFTRALNSWFSRAGEGASLALSVNDFGSNRSPHQGTTSTAGMDLTLKDILEWMRNSHFKISHLDLFDVTHFPHNVQVLCKASSQALLKTTLLVLTHPQAHAPSFDNDVLIVDMSSALPNLNTLVLKSRFAGFIIWRPTGRFIHRTLEKLELSELRSSPIQVASILRGFPALKSLMLTDCSIDSLTRPQPPSIHPCIQEVILQGETSGYLLRNLTCPSLTRVVLNAVKSGISWGSNKFISEAPLALGSLIQRSDLPTVTLCLEYSYPHISLNIILSSTTKVAPIEVPALPILYNEAGNGPGLKIPPSVEWIVSHRAVSGRDRARWLANLKDCLQDPVHQRVSVRLGADDIVRI